MKIKLSLLLLLLVVLSCNSNLGKKDVSSNDLFTVLTAEETNIFFNNQLEETELLNAIVYPYYYNGAGLAAADFNNDNLIDIYFISNRRPNRLYLNQGNLRFMDVTKEANAIGKYGFPGGVTVVDINNDGLMDIYISKSGKVNNLNNLRNELLVNQGINNEGVPVFKEMAEEYQLDLPYNSTQAEFFDYDLDGDLDMILINHGTDMYNGDDLQKLIIETSEKRGEKLYRNDDGKFVDVTTKSGIKNNFSGFTLGISVGDINNDGWPDVFTGNDFFEKDNLYLNNRDGTFKDVSLESFGHISQFSMGSDMADLNNDGLIDIVAVDMTANDNYTNKTSMSGMNVAKFNSIVAHGHHYQYMNNVVQINNGVDPKTEFPMFSDIAQLAGVSSTDWSWSPLIFDMDNDGIKDLFISNGIKRNLGNKDIESLFDNEYKESLGKNPLDVPNFEFDLLLKTPPRKRENYFFINSGKLRFNQVDLNQPETSSNGAAYADFDNDGDIDVIVNNSDDYAFIYRNNSENINNYLKIDLKGFKENTSGVGARVEIKTRGTSQIVEKYYSRGFQSASADKLHFGLGKHEKIDTLIINWPNGKQQYKFNIKANQTLSLNYDSLNAFSKDHKVIKELLFNDISDSLGIVFSHRENDFNDFENESLIPHKMSMMGPALCVADVDEDGLEDFYIGGAKDQTGSMYIQQVDGQFVRSNIKVFNSDKKHEDTGALFFDADNDGDQDLYVVSGGNEEIVNSTFYEDRFYENKGNGKFLKSEQVIPKVVTSGLSIEAGDYDRDGDLDLFVGSRLLPGNYGKFSKSYILENRSDKKRIKFVDVTENIIPELLSYSMVTDAVWIDYDNNSSLDLVISNEWGNVDFFNNRNGKFKNVSEQLGLSSDKGWWFSLNANDIDDDGDIDILAGNLGLNYKYKASNEEPFHMYLNDFDKNNSGDIVLAYHQENKLFPLRGRECSSNQMPFIKEKFQTYDSYGKAELIDVYGVGLENAQHFIATNFSSGIFKKNKGRFKFEPFDISAQISSINEIIVFDFDKDGFKDILLFGNLFSSEVETTRNDASYGHYLKGDGKGNFTVISANESGLFVKGDVKNAALIHLGNKRGNNLAVLIARNNDTLILLEVNSE